MTQKLYVVKGQIQGWYCKCEFYNDILTVSCINPECRETRDLELTKIASFRALERLGMAIDNNDIELHTKFFNHETLVVANMSMEELIAHIEDLEKIVFEAKARLSAATGNKRERIAKLSKEEREKLISDSGLDVANSDSLIKKRAERISKADKMLQGFAGLGLDADTIKGLMANVKVNENTQAISNDTNRKNSDIPISFNKPKPTTSPDEETKPILEIEQKEIEQKPEPKTDKPFWEV